MLNGWVQPRKLRFLIQHLFLVIAYDFIQVLFHIQDIDKITMLVQIFSFQLKFKGVMMRVWKIFSSPIPADKKVPCNEIPLYSKCVHTTLQGYGLTARMIKRPFSLNTGMANSNASTDVQ